MATTPLKMYEALLDKGVKKDFEDEVKEYTAKRLSSIEDSKADSLIISPSKASFHMDVGGGFTIFKGECHRHAFLAAKGFPVTNEVDASAIRRMRYGKIYEAQEHTYEEKAGVLVEKNLRLNKEVSKGIIMSGEIDTIIRLPDDKLYIVEIKSYDGYYAIRQVQGNKSRVGMPKHEHIVQNMHYLLLVKDKYPDIDTVIFHYRTRGDLTGTYHLMKLEDVYDEKGEIIDSYPVINGTRMAFVSLRQLITRGVTLANHIAANMLPPRDPEIEYSDTKIEYLLSIDEVSKNKYQDWQKGKAIIGDWQCSKFYCRYCNLCRGSKPTDKTSWPSDEQIMAKLDSQTVDSSFDIDSMMWSE